MKPIFAGISLVFSIVFCSATLSLSDPIAIAPIWYLQLSGATQGAMKIQFTGEAFTGTGATKGGGVMEVAGTCSFTKTDICTGTYTADSDFSFEQGTLQGKLSKNGDKLTINLVSTAGDRYAAKGVTSPPNTMIGGTFNISVSGRDRGSFVITSGNSGLPDIFRLSGTGEMVQNGTTALKIAGYCDGSGNIYGSWSADGQLASVEGTFSGKFKNGKISARCVSTEGYVFNIKN